MLNEKWCDFEFLFVLRLFFSLRMLFRLFSQQTASHRDLLLLARGLKKTGAAGVS
jgi:hypothetical protein